MKSEKILIGNTFPIAMVKRNVKIYPITLKSLRNEIVNSKKVYTYWGHENTRNIAQKILGIEFPKDDFRKPLSLSAEGYPLWGNIEFKKCYILSPNYRDGFRPSINREVTLDEILSWKALEMEWY